MTDKYRQRRANSEGYTRIHAEWISPSSGTMQYLDGWYYDHRGHRIEYIWDGERRDGYAWDTTEQRRVGEWRTLRELRADLAQRG